MTVVMGNRDTTTDIPNNHTPDININKMILNNHIHSSSIPRNFKDVVLKPRYPTIEEIFRTQKLIIMCPFPT